MNNLMDGLSVSLKIRNEIQLEIEENKYTPSLVVIQVGNDKASNLYIKNKLKASSDVGIKVEHIKFETNTKEEVIINKIKELNLKSDVNGILVQLPLPKGFNEGNIINSIDPVKDVDGLTYENVGNLVLENDCLVSCTPLGVIELLKAYNVKPEGKHAVIVGRSNLVGKPLIQLLLKHDATVSICHSKSSNIKNITKTADILIVAAGHANLITKDMVKDKAIVIDVGINKENNILCGDVNFNDVKKKASLITPVPGGVGPMTVACLIKNILKAYKLQNDIKK